MRRGIKKKDHENLSSESIDKVIAGLEQSKPITKKEACEMLNISYNTTRLARIIQDHKDRKAFIAARKAANKGRGASPQEIVEAVSSYLQGQSISEIASGMYRSSGFVKALIERVGVPQKPIGEEKEKIALLPEACCADSFEANELVWSARHHSTARVRKELTAEYVNSRPGLNPLDYEKKYGAKCYNIYVLVEMDSSDTFFPGVNSGGYNATVPAYDLGKLSHLAELGVRI